MNRKSGLMFCYGMRIIMSCSKAADVCCAFFVYSADCCGDSMKSHTIHLEGRIMFNGKKEDWHKQLNRDQKQQVL